jgi:hypothetical protein
MGSTVLPGTGPHPEAPADQQRQVDAIAAISRAMSVPARLAQILISCLKPIFGLAFATANLCRLPNDRPRRPEGLRASARA